MKAKIGTKTIPRFFFLKIRFFKRVFKSEKKFLGGSLS